MKKLLLYLLLLAGYLGNAQTIQLLKEFVPGTFGCDVVSPYTVLNGELYFGYNYELWQSDGTPSGTNMLKPLDVLSEFIISGGMFFFIANDGSGKMLWKSDGTLSGTMPVGNGYTIEQYSTELKQYNGNFFFDGCDPVHGCELWISDGTDQGTRMIKDIEVNTGPQSGGAFNFFGVNNYLYFSQNDTTIVFPLLKLWKTDGVHVTKVSDIFTGAEILVYNNKAYAISDSNYKDTLPSVGVYEIDLSTGNYSLLYPGLTDIYDPSLIGGKVLFAGGNNFNSGDANLFILDTLNAHVEKISDTFFAMKELYRPVNNKFSFLSVLNGNYYLLKNEGNSIGHIRNASLWKTDGTSAGTVKLTLPGEIKYINDIAAAGGFLFFKAYDTLSQRVDIWYIDQQEYFHRIDPGLPDAPVYTENYWPKIVSLLSDPFVIYGNSLLFTNLYDSAIGKELYKIDLPLLSVTETTPHQAAIYPNPAAEYIYISEANILQAIITDNTGKTILTTNEKKICVQQFASGIYFLDIRLKNGERRFAKFVKE